MNILSKRIAFRVSTMIDARLICYKHYYRWADQLIAELDDPPVWILEIAVIKYPPDAITAVNRFVFSEPFESFDGEECSDEYVACLYLRYRIGAISWATFLEKAGEYTDANQGRHCCEYFYAFLTVLENHEYSSDVEELQRCEVESEFFEAIDRIRPIFEEFMLYFREYVASQR